MVRSEWLLATCCASAALAVGACGGTVQNGDATTSGGSGAPASAGQGGGSSGTGGVGTGGRVTMQDGGGATGGRVVDKGCPPAMKIQGTRECDPFSTAPSVCPEGTGCLPYVRYGDECQTEEIGTACSVVGTGRQGDDCASGDCAAGFVCVTAGTGFQCAALCQLVGSGDTCTGGLLCTPLDVDGFFVCG